MARVRKFPRRRRADARVALVLGACSPRGQPSAPVTNTPEVSAMADGWIALFDGTSTAALRGYGQDAFPASWTVEDGELRAVPAPGWTSSPVRRSPISSSSSSGGL